MDHSQVNGSNGFAYDHSSWVHGMAADGVDPAFFFGGDESVPVGQLGYGVPTESAAPYSQDQSHLVGFGSGYQSQGFDQYDQLHQAASVEPQPHLQNNHHVQEPAILHGYPQAYGTRPSISQIGYPAPRVASPYLQQPAVGHGMDGYNDPHPSNNGYIQQNSAQQQSAAGLPQSHQAQFFDHSLEQQQATPPVQQQRTSTPQQQAQGQLLYAQAQQQRASIQQQQQQLQAQGQQQQASIQQQQQLQAQAQQHQQQQQLQAQAQAQHAKGLQQQHVTAPPYQAHAQQPIPVQHQQPTHPDPRSSTARHVSAHTPSGISHLSSFPPQQYQPGLSVPDRLLMATPNSIAPTTENTERWTGMQHAFVGDTPEEASDKFSNERLMPVFARTERRRLFNERPLLIPAEAMGRYMDSLKSVANDDPQAGIKHRTRRLVLEYDLQRVGGLDRDALDTYDKVPKSGPSKFQAEARKRGFEYPALAPQSSISELDLLEMRTAAMLDLPTTWTPDAGLIQQVAADFAEFLAQVVKELRALPEYKELINAIRASKGRNGTSAQETARSNKLKAANDKGRERVRRVVATALRVADDRVLAALNPNRMLLPFQAVINMFNTGDINAPLTKALLHFAGRLPFLDDSLVAGFKWDKLLARLEDGGDEDVKAAVRKIKDIVKSNEGKPPVLPKQTSAAAADGEAPSKTTSAKARANVPSSGNGTAKVSTSASSAKRPRNDEEAGEGRVTKKAATDQRASISQTSASQTNPQSSQAALKPASTAQGQGKSASATILNALKARASTGALPGKSRPAAKVASKTEAAKPERTDSDNKPPGNTQLQLSSSSKPEVAKLSTTTSTSEPRKMTSNVKKEVIKPETSRSGSSFAALMSEIEKPKVAKRPSPTPNKTEVPVDETDEERERRLRKEKRRRLNLRVSFKSEPELTAVRIFHKEEAEDEERDDHMIRDANDDKAEGRLLRASRSSQIDTDREWEEPILIDFSAIPEEQREKTYVTRGGHIKVETEQQRVLSEKERTEVMAVYTDPADIPPSASSPRPDTDMDVGQTGIEVAGDPNLAARAALFMACGPRGGLELLLRRSSAATTSTAAVLVGQVQNAAPYQNFHDPQVRRAKDEAVVQALTSAAARNYIDPEPAHPQLSKIRRDYADPAVQAASRSLEALVGDLAGLPAPAQEPPKWQQDPARREEWINGFNSDKRAEEATRQAAAQQSAMLSYNPPAAQQAPDPYAQYYQQLQATAAQATGQAQQQAHDPLAATLAALQSAAAPPPAAQPAQADPMAAFMAAAFGNQQQQQAPAVDPNQALQLAMWAAAASGAQQQQQPQPSSQQQFGQAAAAYGGQDGSQRDEEHRNRDRDRGGRRGGKGGGGGSGGDDDHLRGINRALIGTKPCTFWARGNCNRGDKCTFRHG